MILFLKNICGEDIFLKSTILDWKKWWEKGNKVLVSQKWETSPLLALCLATTIETNTKYTSQISQLGHLVGRNTNRWASKWSWILGIDLTRLLPSSQNRMARHFEDYNVNIMIFNTSQPLLFWSIRWYSTCRCSDIHYLYDTYFIFG